MTLGSAASRGLFTFFELFSSSIAPTSSVKIRVIFVGSTGKSGKIFVKFADSRDACHRRRRETANGNRGPGTRVYTIDTSDTDSNYAIGLYGVPNDDNAE